MCLTCTCELCFGLQLQQGKVAREQVQGEQWRAGGSWAVRGVKQFAFCPLPLLAHSAACPSSFCTPCSPGPLPFPPLPSSHSPSLATSASRLQGLVLMRNFNYQDICLERNSAVHKQSNKLTECVGNNFDTHGREANQGKLSSTGSETGGGLVKNVKVEST